MSRQRAFNGPYTGEHLEHVAFPLGGIGAGMICLEGNGTLSHVSLRHRPEVVAESYLFSALCVKGRQNAARILEGPIPKWKIFNKPDNGGGVIGPVIGVRQGLPHFAVARFQARFPFGVVRLEDEQVPLRVEITGWSPFIPGDADNSSLPVVGLEYRFTNPTRKTAAAVYSFHAANFLNIPPHVTATPRRDAVHQAPHGFTFSLSPAEGKPWEQGAFYAGVDASNAVIDCAWFREGWYEAMPFVWQAIAEGRWVKRLPFTEGDPSPGASLYVPFTLKPRGTKTIRLMLAWHVPSSNLRLGEEIAPVPAACSCADKTPATPQKPPLTYQPWYAARFSDIDAVSAYWREHYREMREKTATFTRCFYDTTLPDEVVEAAAANLTILKSPTVLRQADGRLWAWEGCGDGSGCCPGSCTHVWNYAQALPHLFPELERGLRETEFFACQDEGGHQSFRASLPIRPSAHKFHAAADGQLGGIIKTFREWRISGDTAWLRRLWPQVRKSLDYCIATWDPRCKGALEEPHHNTYDIEFWGPDGMCCSLYAAALKAAALMGKALNDDVLRYESLYGKARTYLEKRLFNGEYFEQRIEWKKLSALSPVAEYEKRTGRPCPPEVAELMEREGPRNQYGKGCLSDGVLGAWLAEMCGLGEILDSSKVEGHLRAVYHNNFRKNLSGHANLFRPGYAVGNEGGLVLCTWPKGGKPSLPFLYSGEVWTGIEYQVASHLMRTGHVRKGLEIVRACRARYDGTVRNPFNEYECGSWYARALSSYALLQGLTGARYDAVEKTLHLQPSVKGDFRAFLATATGFGVIGVKKGKPFLEVKSGMIEARKIRYQHAGIAGRNPDLGMQFRG
ncbi:MAG: hypothetical protein HY360_21145 [Verrucomicrobia bacterium]|nr:hypothetical protein [Verrucomicrobiota bacterium]